MGVPEPLPKIRGKMCSHYLGFLKQFINQFDVIKKADKWNIDLNKIK